MRGGLSYGTGTVFAGTGDFHGEVGDAGGKYGYFLYRMWLLSVYVSGTPSFAGYDTGGEKYSDGYCPFPYADKEVMNIRSKRNNEYK